MAGRASCCSPPCTASAGAGAGAGVALPPRHNRSARHGAGWRDAMRDDGELSLLAMDAKSPHESWSRVMCACGLWAGYTDVLRLPRHALAARTVTMLQRRRTVGPGSQASCLRCLSHSLIGSTWGNRGRGAGGSSGHRHRYRCRYRQGGCKLRSGV